MRAPSVRSSGALKLGTVLAGMACSALLVWHASYSAYTSTTVNPANAFTTGKVSLTDDDAGVAMFSGTSLKPGSTGTKCIQVSSTSTVAGAVKLYATSGTYSTTNGLGSYLNLTIDQVPSGTFATSAATCAGYTASSTIYTGTFADFSSSKTGFATGVGSWTLTGTPTETQAYRFTYTVSSSAPDTTQNGTVALGFTWEAQSS